MRSIANHHRADETRQDEEDEPEFTPAFQIVQRLLAAKRDLRLTQELRKLDRFEVLIVDDIGYVQQSREEMEVLFTLLAERYERRSVLITSNLVFSKWDQIFKDTMTTAAATRPRGASLDHSRALGRETPALVERHLLLSLLPLPRLRDRRDELGFATMRQDEIRRLSLLVELPVLTRVLVR